MSLGIYLSKFQTRATVFAAIGGLLALMGGMVYFASLDNTSLEQVEIELFEIRLLDVNQKENRAELETTFLIRNPGEKTFTIPLITYELFANDKSLGNGQYSTADIAMTGRAAIVSGGEIPLKSNFKLVLADDISQEYYAITNGEEVYYRVKGIITVETAWSIVEKEFEKTL